MRKLSVVSLVTVVSALAFAAPAFAWTHGQFNATTDACAGCHVAHAAPAPKLLKAGPTQTEFCYLCHGEGTTSAPYDVQYGKTFGQGSTYPSTAGGFERLWVGPGANDYQTVTSRHTLWGYLPDTLNEAGTWDGESRYFSIPGGTSALTGNGLTCGACHDPHAGGKTPDGNGWISGNPRLMRTAILDQTVDNVRFKLQHIGALSYGGSTSDVFRVTAYKEGSSAWCGACHDKFNPPSSGEGHASLYLDMWRHPMDAHVLPPPDFDGSLATGTPLEQPGSIGHVTCLSCHRAHGATVQMEGWAADWPRDDGSAGNTTALLRMDNRGICYNCHGAGRYNCWNDTRLDCAGCHSGGGGGAHAPDNPGDWCMDCHLDQSHSTHFDTSGKGPGIPEDETGCSVCHTAAIPDLKAGACDTCHSPGGAFNGVQMAQAGWAEGIYESDGVTLKSGKEQWCASCHDDAPAFSKQQPVEITVDNPAGTFTGNWPTSSWAPGYYGSDYAYHDTGAGSDTFTWTPAISTPGTYTVYARWTQDPTRAPDAAYTIYHDGGAAVVTVNQRANGGTWYLLGAYAFDGIGDKVELVQNPNGYVIADAVLFESGGPGTYAPNISGDNATYGFYVTGHKIDCLSCHDAAKRHIDGEHRTYDAGVTDYSNSYRLKDINGQPAMNVPRPLYGAGVLPILHKDDFTLCFDCHNAEDVLTNAWSVVGKTNFWNDDDNDQNSHNIHLGISTNHFDSDWDGTTDSAESCVACHNVHGSPSRAMIRHGELISAPGTTNKVPALNFAYLTPSPPGPTATATWTFNVALDGDYKVYAWWKATTNRATDAPFTVNYSGGSQTVRVNQQANGSQWNELGTFSFITTAAGSVVLGNDADGYVIADAIKVEKVGGGTPDIVMDEEQAAYVSAWTYVSGDAAGYNSDFRWHAKVPGGVFDPNATLEESIGGMMNYTSGSLAGNHVCQACHSAVSYYRTPNFSPKVMNAQATPDTVSDSSQLIRLTASVQDPDGDFSGNIVVNLTSIGGGANQQMYDNGTNGDVIGGDGVYSYVTTIAPDTTDTPKILTVTATDGAANQGEALIDLNVVEAGCIYVDNADATFIGSWTLVSGDSASYRYDYRYRAAGDGSSTATWVPAIPVSGSYSVYAWWKANSNRATDAPYTVNYNGGSQTIDVNQEINGSRWNLLGTFAFAAGASGSIVLSNDANEYVIADAVKFKPQP
jgi:predicted CXXCH cytochrome family protein